MKKDTPVKSKKHPAAKPAAKRVWINPPKIGHEASRQQVMARSGEGGKGSCVAFRYKDYGGKAGAWKKAQEWLRKMQAEYAKHT